MCWLLLRCCLADLQRGELANRILSVGSMDRALLIADNLEGAEGQKFQHLSGRGFLTITGVALRLFPVEHAPLPYE
jgi:hypothetical protein